MNLKEYISSGILELYVLGELPEHERAEVEKNLVLYSELRDELKLVEEAQEHLLLKAAIKPRAAVKASLFEKIDAMKPEAKVVTMETGSSANVWRFAAAASITVALISSYMAYNYHSKWRDSETSFNELIAQNQRMAQDYNTVNQRIDKIETDLKVVNDPGFSRIIMKGTDNAPQALASVYWNASSKEVYLNIQNMKELAQEHQYQLWAIIDGKPVDAGVFDGNLAALGLVKMKNIPEGAAAFAVTVEPRGGKESPTLSTMQVVGNVIKG